MKRGKDSARVRLRISLTLALLVWLVLLLLPSVAHAQESASPKRVLVLYWYNKDHPWNILFDQSFQAILQSAPEGTVESYSEYLESNRFPGENQSRLLRDYLKQKYADRTIDVVVANSDASLDFLLKYRADLFPHAPVVFVATRDPSKESLATGPGITGIIILDTHRENLDLALSLHPGTKQVFIISGTLERDKRFETLARKELQGYETNAELVYLTDLSREELIAKAKGLAEGSIVFHVWQQSRNEQGKVIEHSEMLAPIARSATVPVYAMNFLTIFSLSEDSIDGSGVVGGLITTPGVSGAKVAEIALRIANGAQAHDIPVEPAPTVPMFDWRELRRWGIDESKLPAGSIVRYRRPTLWQQYKWRIIGVVSLITLQALLIIWLLINRARRRRAEEASNASEQRYRNVVETQTELICRYLPDTTLTFVNDAYCRHFGRTHDQLIGTKFTELMPEHAREAALGHVASLIENPRAEAYEHEVILPNGSQGWQQWVDKVVGSSNGHGVELQGIGRDITEKRQAEHELRLSETRFRHMADTAPVMIWIADRDMLCTFFNQRVLDFTGQSMDELLGEGWGRTVHEDDFPKCKETYTAAYARKEPFVMEFRFRRADGEFRWFYDTGAPRFGPNGELLGYIGSAVDITDRRAAEEALQIAHEEVSRLKNQLEAENVYLQEEIKLAHNVDEILGESNAIKYVLFKIEQVAETDTTVLILGETGTGKELVARAIHSQSLRKDRPLVKVNCAALSASLIESELFGHEKGAFTGAASRKIGRFELADGATIFLDEIGELPLELQPKLLRVIQEGEFERLGGSKTIKVDVRLITATNRNMKLEVEKGNFREDLWYRLNVFPITVPPLRQRKEDIPLMMEHFVSTFSKKVGKTITAISAAALKKFQDYSWPGNVRELANVIERAVVTAHGPVLQIADQFEQQQPKDRRDSTQTLEGMEKEHITRILDQTAWRIEGPTGAARILGLNPSTLRTRMVKLGIQKNIRNVAGRSRAAN